METLAKLAGGIIVATPSRVIDVTDTNSEAEASVVSSSLSVTYETR